MNDIYVAHRGAKLHVRLAGDGPPVMVLHGFTGSVDTMAEVCARLTPTRRVVAVDLLGHGKSDAPADDAAYAMEAEVARLLAVLDHLDIPAVDVIGFSMGARTALSLSVAAPRRTASLVLIGARAGFADAADRAARVEADITLARRVEAIGVAAFIDEFYSQPLFATRLHLGPEALAADRSCRLAATPRGLAGSLRGLGAGAMTPLHDRLHTVAAPMLLIVGAEDDVRFHDSAAEIAVLAPNASVAIISGAGHAAHMENPDAFMEVALRFLSGRGGSQPRSGSIS